MSTTRVSPTIITTNVHLSDLNHFEATYYPGGSESFWGLRFGGVGDATASVLMRPGIDGRDIAAHLRSLADQIETTINDKEMNQ